MSLHEKIKSALEGVSLPGSVRILFGEHSVGVSADGTFLNDNEECDCTLSLEENTLSGIIDGSVDPMGAYFSGNLKIEGDMGVAMALSGLLKG